MTLLVSGQSSAVAIIHFPYCNWILSKYCPAVGGGVVIGQNIYILINLVFQKKGLPMAPLTLHVFLNFKGSESSWGHEHIQFYYKFFHFWVQHSCFTLGRSWAQILPQKPVILRFTWFFSVSIGKCLKSGHEHFLLHPFKFITNHSYYTMLHNFSK
jgi:hypothetical protein